MAQTFTVFENKTYGIIIAPRFFPVTILSQKFGYTKFYNEYLNSLDKVSYYIDFNDSRNPLYLLKPIPSPYRSSSAMQFYSAVQDNFSQSNAFTSEYVIEDCDIEHVDDYKESHHTSASTSDNEFTLTRKNSDKLVPLESCGALELRLDSNEEEALLRAHINYYLNEIGLACIDLEKNNYPLHFLSTKGDSYIYLSLLDHFDSRRAITTVSSNNAMQLALGRSGWVEFLEVHAHLAGTFFEVLYACAHLQKNDTVIRDLEVALVGNVVMSEQSNIVTFV